MMMTTNQMLHLLFVHDVLVSYKITPPLTYIEIRSKIDTDKEFVQYLQAYSKLLTTKEQ
jgi:hypothetical protein